ncbi:hypothetical protein [Bradyrhizobium sp. SZCCHNPS1003]|uniref:hypothetical protein n=1 Tax=Bradyrhizobium sp. SZCCHNPS1003 TaxID=3057330 RepID=UPI0028EDEA33|nr:hypothetical protein [Bradyrhizobium sp. SZCCHNPS1003]
MSAGRDDDLRTLLPQVLARLARDEDQLDCDIEKSLFEALSDLGCAPFLTEKLVDYIPSACGRAFLREVGAVPSDRYTRPNLDGSRGRPLRFADDPIWMIVEEFVETLRTSPETRKQFALAARHSAEVVVLNKALNAGIRLEDIKGSRVATAFIAPLRFEVPGHSGRASPWRRLKRWLSNAGE